MHVWVSQVVLVVKNSPANAGDTRCSFNPWVGKIPWRRTWQPTPVFLPGESHGQRSLAGDSHRVAKSQTRLSIFAHMYVCFIIKISVFCHEDL